MGWRGVGARGLLTGINVVWPRDGMLPIVTTERAIGHDGHPTRHAFDRHADDKLKVPTMIQINDGRA